MQPAFVDRIAEALRGEKQIAALLLGGSHGRGSSDAFSDFDFIAVADAHDHRDVAVLWRRVIEAVAPVVYGNERGGPTTLINAITRDWLRVDLSIVDAATLIDRAERGAAGYSQATLRMLFDRAGIYPRLPEAPPEPQANPKQVEATIYEFIRVLGLISIGMGRGELVLGVTGAGLLRDLLIRLMVEETHSPERGGALHLSRTLTEDQMDVLLALPYPGPDRAEILAAHRALARAFFPRARALAAALAIEWPSAFEEATRRHLARAFGAETVAW